MIASNFTTFLQLLTTQLQNQNPLDPLDTNQFTQQLVQFAQVEQQMKSNDQLSTLISLEASAQSATALTLSAPPWWSTARPPSSPMAARPGTSMSPSRPPPPSPSRIRQRPDRLYRHLHINPGNQPFTWNGQGNDGTQWPDGSYTITIAAVDANKQPVGVSTEIQATVDSVDLTQNPPVLSINGQNYTIDKIKKIVRSTA